MADALSGVADDARGEAVAPRVVINDRVEASFFSKGVDLRSPWKLSKGTHVRAYFSGESFEVAFGDTGAQFSLWMDEGDLEALIGDLMASLVRARIAREQAS